VTKDQPVESNTGYAQGGVAVAMGLDDETDIHLQDTLKAGAGLVSESAARVLVEEGPERVRELVAWGARFDREEGRFHFTKEGAHSRSRVLHALGDATGWEMVRALLERTGRESQVTVRAFACSTDLVSSEGRVLGCRFLPQEGSEETTILARATLLATGGAGQVFRETTNPLVATGDGMAMAARAGAALLDMEFVQFHPTALAVGEVPRFLVSEAVRGEGAYLRNVAGERFIEELAPRDQVARAIYREQVEGRGPVSLDLSHLDPDRVRSRFPRIAAACQRHGIDMTKDPVPVTPAAHYVMGGVATDLGGRSTLPGLYAAGEVAGTGVHGANRLASNSLLEGLVFGARAAEAMIADAHSLPDEATAAPAASQGCGAEALPDKVGEAVRGQAWQRLGLVRDADGLAELIGFLDGLRAQLPRLPSNRTAAEERNLAEVAHAMAVSALYREESRGGHFRRDFPKADDGRFRGHTWLERSGPRLVDLNHPFSC
jgi:L-aspartate oxidase